MTQYGDGQGAAGQSPGYSHRYQEEQKRQWDQPSQYDAPQYDRPPQHQPTYSQQYGQPPYGQQPGYASNYQQAGYPLDSGSTRTIGVTGLVFTIIGAVALLLAFTVLSWFHQLSGDSLGQGSGSSTFSNVHNQVHNLKHGVGGGSQYLSFGVSDTYFSWLGWTLLVAAVLAALIACLPTAATPIMRVIALLLGLAGAGLTVWATNLVTFSGPLKQIAENQLHSSVDFTFWLKHSYLGAWFAIGGFVLVAFGGLIGSSRKRY